ncbi:MAG: hypothetical protein CVV29_03570 [Methanobacteriales archaeon HGW-Methanobacteriales-2]|nr:MAG: hypothetical protein CVV29_03570 [Methanobacteriales archaeon HGW-Methanobacteriales-2]
MGIMGTWHIYEMELWDEDYFNTEVQAYIEINSSNRGYFQFGLVSGRIDVEVVFYATEHMEHLMNIWNIQPISPNNLNRYFLNINTS